MNKLIKFLLIITFGSFISYNVGGNESKMIFFVGDLVILFSFFLLIRKNSIKKKSFFVNIVFIILIQAFLSVLYKSIIDQGYFFYQLGSYLSNYRIFYFSLIGYVSFGKIDLDKVLKYSYTLMLITVINGVFILFSRLNFNTLSIVRTRWDIFDYWGDLIWGYPNSFATFMSVYFFIGLYLKKKELVSNRLVIIGNIFIVVVLLFSGSRSAILSLIVSLIVYSMIIKKFTKIIGILIILSIVLLYNMPEYLLFKLAKTFGVDNGLDLSFSLRLSYWYYAYEYALLNPLFGSGFLPFKEYITSFLGSKYSFSTPHQDYATIAYKTGLLGFLLFFLFFYTVIKTMIKNLKKDLFLKYFLPAFIGVLFSSLTQDNIFYLFLGTFIFFIIGYKHREYNFRPLHSIV